MTEALPDPHVALEMAQLVAALRNEGPQSDEDLARLVGARYWLPGRFEQALTSARGRGLVATTDDALLTST